MRLKTLSFAVGYHCNARCDHCCVNSGPEIPSQDALSAEEMLRVLRHAPDDLQSVSFTGGEPTRMLHRVLPVVEACRKRGLHTRLVTNAGWAVSPHASRMMIDRLRAAGLNELAISTSVWHRAFVCLDRCVEAAREALHQGLRVQFLVVSATAPDDACRDVYQALEEALPTVPAYHDCVEGRAPDSRLTFHAGSVTTTGRASTLPASSFRRHTLAKVNKTGCGMLLRPMTVTADRKVMACCGFPYRDCDELTLGPLDADRSVLDYARQAQRSPLLQWIHAVGPWRILQVLDPERFADEATVPSDHICQGCAVLFGDPVMKERLTRYLDRRGNDVFFDECFQPVLEQVP